MEKIYKFAEDNNIKIDSIKSKSLKSLSMPDAIGINEEKMENNCELKTCLIHEIGHCVTGSFYNAQSKFELRERQEYRADKWAIEKYIPFDELILVLHKGHTEAWSVAEYFEVTEEFVKKAFLFYEERLLKYREL